MRINLYQRGDTIVEVLIAIGVISLVLTAAFVTANRSYLTMQDAQERSSALKLLEREAEAIKQLNAQPGGHTQLTHAPHDFCAAISNGTPQIKTTSSQCLLYSDATLALGRQPAYAITINPDTTTNIGDGTAFKITATWDSLLGKTPDTAQIEYGLY